MKKWVDNIRPFFMYQFIFKLFEDILRNFAGCQNFMKKFLRNT